MKKWKNENVDHTRQIEDDTNVVTLYSTEQTYNPSITTPQHACQPVEVADDVRLNDWNRCSKIPITRQKFTMSAFQEARSTSASLLASFPCYGA
ncbi:hypothetical protein T07_13029 [Trichinella nelsoni]|uniref:Uncharacterized protein n=1 Tax=Trichinella nelsoni TaxID=6336 RepID=A0A0V0RY15_9BILA|nr:hypothetical protein T07_13029 [Trichinella nelsoni]